MDSGMLWKLHQEKERQDELARHRSALMSAYVKKTERRIVNAQTMEKTRSESRIKSLGPIRDLTTVGKVVPKITNKWWLKKPTLAGERCNTRQNRIASGNANSQRQLAVTEDNDMGDFYHDPKKVRKLLMNRTYRELTNIKNTTDFKTEVTWRLGLREWP